MSVAINSFVNKRRQRGTETFYVIPFSPSVALTILAHETHIWKCNSLVYMYTRKIMRLKY